MSSTFWSSPVGLWEQQGAVQGQRVGAEQGTPQHVCARGDCVPWQLHFLH